MEQSVNKNCHSLSYSFSGWDKISQNVYRINKRHLSVDTLIAKQKIYIKGMYPKHLFL